MISALAPARLFDGERFSGARVVLVENGRISDLVDEADVPRGVKLTRLPGLTLAPGYVDLQVNGGGGVLFNDDIGAAGLARIAAAHRGLGTTSIMATLISPSRAMMQAARELLAAESVPGVVGLHLEGPFLAPSRRGIHPAESILTMLPDDLAALCVPGAMRLLVTLAPECVPPGAVARLAQAGVLVFAGHSEADAAQMAQGFAEGLRGATHLFNAMSQITPREPGVVGAVLADPAALAGLILDGLHVHPANAALAFRLLGPRRLLLVSDAMPTVGGDGAAFHVGATEVRLEAGRLAGPDGTLGGAHLCLAEAVRNAIAWLGATPEEALRMASLSPAEAIGLDDRGRIAPGAMADLVALDGEWQVRGVWAEGQPV